MVILYLEQDIARLKKYLNLLNQWGYEVTLANQPSDVYRGLNQEEQSFHVFLIGSIHSHEDAIKLIQQTRLQNYYIYIMNLFDPKERFKAEVLLETGADELLSVRENTKYTQLRFAAVSRLLRSLNQNQDVSLAKSGRILQILDINKALDQVDNNRSLLKSLLAAIIKNIENLLADKKVAELGMLKESAYNADMLGAYWLQSDLLSLMSEVQKYGDQEIMFYPDSSLMNVKLSLKKLKQGVQSLEEFGFFADGAAEDKEKASLLGVTILVVEDVPQNRVLLKAILGKLQADILEAENGKKAIEIWQENQKVDLILMDMSMPVMDGFDATREIRRIESEQGLKPIPIVALTALAMRDDKEQCKAAGCNDYLMKPIVKKDLSQVVFQWSKKKFKSDEIDALEIEKVIMRIDNQISKYCLQEAFNYLGVKCQTYTETSVILEQLTGAMNEVLVLDARLDMNLAFYIKNRNPDQIIIMIGLDGESQDGHLAGNDLTISFPVTLVEVVDTLKKASEKILIGRKKNHALEYARALGSFDSKSALDETVSVFDGQLAAWQQSYGEIGGDLILGKKFNLHDRMGLILADVTGHDAKSAYVGSWFSGLVKGVWNSDFSPRAFLSHLNELYPHNDVEEDKRYICSLVLLWDRLREKLYFGNAGIPAGLLIKKGSNDSQWIEWTGSPVGMFEGMEMFDHGVMDFTYGDRLIIASDGILEAIPESVFKNLIEDSRELSVQAMLDKIVDFVTRTIDIQDDLTLVVFESSPMRIKEGAVRYSIGSSFSEIDRIMEAIQKELEISATAIDIAESLMSIREGLLNAVEHGNKKVVGEPVDIDLIIETSRVEVIISDRGNGFNFARTKKRLENEGPQRIQGRGIEMMEAFADKVTYVNGSLILEFVEKKK